MLDKLIDTVVNTLTLDHKFDAETLDADVDRFCDLLTSRPRPAILGLKEYLRSAPHMDDQGALNYARSIHSMVNTAAAMKKNH